MRYGFTKCGGFAAVDDERRIGAFAYRTSDAADAAIVWPEVVARRMLAELVPTGFPNIVEDHYEIVCKALAGRLRLDP